MSDISTDQEEALRVRARQRIEQGLLPHEKPTRMWGGRGTGLPCSLCDAPILESQPEMELEYEPAARTPTVRFHLRCQSVWDRARQQPSASQWVSVDNEMPPLHTVVEARLSLSATRSIILNVMRVCDGETGPVVWLNATTNGQLPAAWRPLEWRSTSERRVAAANGPASAPGMTRHG